MKARATNEHSKVDGNIAIKTPTITSIYITVGTKTVVKPKKEGDPEKTKITLDKKYNQGLFGRKYFLVVETKDFPTDSNAKFKISFRSKIKALSEQDTSFKVLLDSTDVESIEIPFNNYFNDELIENKKDFENKSIIEFAFDRKEDKDRDEYKDLISKTMDKYATAYLHIEEILDEESTIDFNGDATSKDKKDFYFEKTFNLYQECFCNRDMTVQELKTIILALRNKHLELSRLPKEKEYVIFADSEKLPLNTNDRTYDRLVQELNSMFKKYEINTCNRKAYFLSQTYVESGRFSTTIEEAEGKNYELKNWENNQSDLKKSIELIDQLKPQVDSIIAKIKDAVAIDESKNQIEEVAAKTKGLQLTEDEKLPINQYKGIFEKKWQSNFDSEKKQSYTTKQNYESALKYAENRVSTIRTNGNVKDGDGPRYKGKGLIQLTWRDGYEKYFNYLKNLNTTPDSLKNKDVKTEILNRGTDDMSQLLATDLYYAVDSAGWVWVYFKKDIRKYYEDRDGDVKSKYSGKIRTAKDNISYIVNGGDHDMALRGKLYDLIKKDVFFIKTNCINYDKIKMV